ncbi:MAG TPA: hypothetical protein VHF67_05710 [Gaiellaceae bacterium]|nr:hypothetical protein [Gaiellaceae bacterium]
MTVHLNWTPTARAASHFALVGVVVLLAAGCGAGQATPRNAERAGTESRTLGERYGIAATLPPGWDGRLRRGALHAASFALPTDAPGWAAQAAEDLAPHDVLVLLFENEPRARHPTDVSEYPERSDPLRLNVDDFKSFDGVTEDSRVSGHGFARRVFQVSGRLFVLYVETGDRVPSRSVLTDVNELLASLTVEPGDFFYGTVAPARFPRRAGWFVGTSGADEARAEGEFTTSWASTIPYADEWNALPPFETLERLPRDGVVIWLGLSRSNRFPPRPEGDEMFPAREPPFSLDEFERRGGWEGQVRDLPEYLLWGTTEGQYNVDLRVYFGRPDPTAAMLAEAQAMLHGLALPDWGPWETR